MQFRHFIFSCITVVVLFNSNAFGQPDLDVIKESELRAQVEFLASPALEGREAPGRGSEQAQKYIAGYFKDYGLKELTMAPGYLQTVPLLISRTDYGKTKLHFSRNGEEIALNTNTDFFYFPKGGKDTDITGEIVLCGFGITATEYNWDDYRDADVSGKFVLVIDGEPLNSDGTSRLSGEQGKPTKYARDIVKSRIAQSKGAIGLIIKTNVETTVEGINKKFGNKAEKMFDPIVQLPDQDQEFPIFYLNGEAAERLMGDSHQFFKAYEYLLPTAPKLVKDQGQRPTVLTVQIRFKDVQNKKTANVIGLLPGEMKDAIVVMAHHDHEGMKNGVLYPGADDNASGVAGLLGIAKAMSKSKQAPEHSILFLSTGAEEKGSLGAIYFIQHPPYPLDKIAAVINMDEIGRDGSSQFRAMFDPSIQGEKDLLMFFYSGQTPDLAETGQKIDQQHLNLMIEPVLTFHSSSDHVPFHEQKIPSIFLFTGFHGDYTSPRDTPEKIVYNKLLRVTRYAASLTWQLASAKGNPTFDTAIKEVERKGKYGQ